MPKKIDLSGKKFGLLVVVGEVHTPKSGTRWLCRCACGNEKEISGQSLRDGKTQSCGCEMLRRRSARMTKHGMSKWSGFGSWRAMVSRCNNSDDKDFPAYGGRGIKVCERWMDPRVFAADMGDKPEGWSIDRLDPDGPYEPANCRWTNAMGQGEHKRNNHRLIRSSKHFAAACREAGLAESTVLNRIKSGEDEGEALTRQPRQRNQRIAAFGQSLTILEWADKTGIKPSTLRLRLARWPVERALTP